MTLSAADTAAIEQTIIATWDAQAPMILEKFAVEGEGGWQYHLRPPMRHGDQLDTPPDHGSIVYRFVYKGKPQRKLGAPKRKTQPHRFGKKVYEVRGTWRGVTVERLERFER